MLQFNLMKTVISDNFKHKGLINVAQNNECDA